MIIYIHGFNSAGSVENDKVIELMKLDDVYIVTYNSFGNANTILEIIASEIEHLDDKVFIGTSLGAFFAAQLGKIFRSPSVMINPVFEPETSLEVFRDVPQINSVTCEHNTLSSISIKSYERLPKINDKNTFAVCPLVIVAEDDEVIPPTLSKEYYRDFTIISTPDGGHSYNKPRQIMKAISDYISRAELITDLNS